MADPLYFAPLRVPLVDQRTGLMAREWYLFFQALWLRTGGGTAPDDNDLILQSMSSGLSGGDVVPLINQVDQALGQAPIKELAELSKDVLLSDPPGATSELLKLFQDLGQAPVLPPQVTPHLEYGTWTPVDASGAVLTLTVDSATYVRHERLVFVRASLTYPVTANGSSAKIGGMPFPTDNNEAVRQGWVTYSGNTNLRYFVPAANAATANFYTNAGVIMTNAQMSATTVYFSALYTTP